MSTTPVQPGPPPVRSPVTSPNRPPQVIVVQLATPEHTQAPPTLNERLTRAITLVAYVVIGGLTLRFAAWMVPVLP